MIEEAVKHQMIELAREASQNAYAPYSHYKVGACCLTSDNKLFTGFNIENASYGLSVCAERTAIWSAMTTTKSTLEIKALAIFTKNLGTPCGACRQVIQEFAEDPSSCLIVLASDEKEPTLFSLTDLLPYPFSF